MEQKEMRSVEIQTDEQVVYGRKIFVKNNSTQTDSFVCQTISAATQTLVKLIGQNMSTLHHSDLVTDSDMMMEDNGVIDEDDETENIDEEDEYLSDYDEEDDDFSDSDEFSREGEDIEKTWDSMDIGHHGYSSKQRYGMDKTNIANSIQKSDMLEKGSLNNATAGNVKLNFQGTSLGEGSTTCSIKFVPVVEKDGTRKFQMVLTKSGLEANSSNLVDPNTSGTIGETDDKNSQNAGNLKSTNPQNGNVKTVTPVTKPKNEVIIDDTIKPVQKKDLSLEKKTAGNNMNTSLSNDFHAEKNLSSSVSGARKNLTNLRNSVSSVWTQIMEVGNHVELRADDVQPRPESEASLCENGTTEPRPEGVGNLCENGTTEPRPESVGNLCENGKTEPRSESVGNHCGIGTTDANKRSRDNQTLQFVVQVNEVKNQGDEAQLSRQQSSTIKQEPNDHDKLMEDSECEKAKTAVSLSGNTSNECDKSENLFKALNLRQRIDSESHAKLQEVHDYCKKDRKMIYRIIVRKNKNRSREAQESTSKVKRTTKKKRVCSKKKNKKKSDVISFPCEFCGETLVKTSLFKHMTSNHDGKVIYKCDVCAREYKCYKSFGVHKQVHTREAKHECSVCGKKFILPYQLKIHEKCHDKSKRFSCKHCNKTFGAKSVLRDHEMRHEFSPKDLNVVPCNICGKKFQNGRKVKLHQSRVHISDDEKFKCEYCGRLFSLKGNLNTHMRTHTGEKPFQCRFCHKSFSLKCTLQEHENRHQGIKMFPCDMCRMTFVNNSELRAHKFSHLGIKPIQCDICGTRLKSKTNLNIHMLIHKDERPFSCFQCGKSFRTKFVLDKHMRTHTGEKLPKRYPCDLCGKKFITSYNMKIHRMNHTGDKPFVCEICGNKFATRSFLKVHKRKCDMETDSLVQEVDYKFGIY